ncbi:putative glucose-methanol-choline oxidoreductase protein [Seiridium unicorne]|uniref:Glucose-methanol-choline oxidoreductase protein n=1 Tax=Seiridium unicorne TaxID=138068 RepID=A0ABR2UHI7_9PEZI
MSSTTPTHYIIVGGGTSGLVVVSRLTENPSVHVLVLEAGKDLSSDPRVNVPVLRTALIGSESAWQFQSVSQSQLGGRAVKLPMGKALGGFHCSGTA